MRKGKRVIKKIQEKIKRQVTFAKRRKSLMKKAQELSVLCDVDIGLIIFSYSDKLYDFCSNSTSMENLIMRYQMEKEGHATAANHSFHPGDCSLDCAKTKESMMREIDNLKLNLHIVQLESSLQHVRPREFEFIQQRQTDKLKGKEILMNEETQQFSHLAQGSSWQQLMWQAERQMMTTCQRQQDHAPASEEGGLPFLRWGTAHRRSSAPRAATTRPKLSIYPGP